MTIAYAISDPCTDLILDFIAGPESGGNYNAYFGHSGSTVSLEWPLDKVYEFQLQLAANNGVSSATGRYQFLHKTLTGLAVELGLPGTTLFTPALQDRLGVALLVRRGYSAWWRTQIGDVELAHRFAMEWASLPDPMNGGRSYYDGDNAGNRALVTLPAVYAMLTQARAAQQVPATVPPPAPPQPDQRLYKISQDLLAMANAVNAISSET